MSTEILDNSTAVPTRKRAVDQLTFHSSHADCYARGIHAKTPQGREMCRTGQGFSGIQDKIEIETVIEHNIKSKISTVVHATDNVDDGVNPLCGVKLPVKSRLHVAAADYPVTCKKCQKLSA